MGTCIGTRDSGKPSPVRNGLLALISGLMAGSGLAILLPARGDVAQRSLRGRAATGDNARRAKPASPEKPAEEQEVLEALGRLGELTAARAALETSLTVEEAERVLSGLAAKGHLRVRVLGNPGGIFYSFWERDAPE